MRRWSRLHRESISFNTLRGATSPIESVVSTWLLYSAEHIYCVWLAHSVGRTTMVELSYLLMRTTGPSLDTLGVVSLVTGLGYLLDTLWVFVGTLWGALWQRCSLHCWQLTYSMKPSSCKAKGRAFQQALARDTCHQNPKVGQ
jgi:hypothetical protein